MTWDEYQRQSQLVAILGTPFKVSPPFDFFDFLTCCWMMVEFQWLERVRYDRPHYEGGHPGDPNIKG